MSNVIPKEKQSAYQRWEMESFGEQEMLATNDAAVEHARASAAAEKERLAEIARKLDEDCEEARAKGYAAGLSEGRKAGIEDGRTAGIAEGRLQAEQERQLLRQIAETFGTEVARANELIAADMLDLSLDLAKAMLKTALKIRPELVVPVVREAIHYLPTLQQPALLHLHPEDAVLIAEHLGDEISTAGWRVVEDTQMERGGCRVETASNQVDATAPVRWQRIAAALGKESDWLES
ncbi:flagellar assembly protein FliH [Oxalicibacterium solurbis]|uniref:Flagellar assembly protein FliH n=2 Tax=Oxalicibacterium solurbis TaxID=69280 RepID=A0A8J3AXU8_9BURK|nr:flagellar assembly protein FliH [Oxalicibacterium solurbis]GGI53037.1 flagellar assembly protein FliH [Oxalicibacterium solurbis]